MKWQDYIQSDPSVLLGKPCIRETRISVEHIIGLLAQGWSAEEILNNYPRLTMEDLKAVYAFVYECLQDGLLYNPIPAKVG